MSYERKLAPDQPAANDPKYVVIELRGRIAELERQVDNLMQLVESRDNEVASEVQVTAEWVKRAEQAEAEVERLKWMLDRLSHQHWSYNEAGNEARRISHLLKLKEEWAAREETP